ncbi:DUF1552 domain-containing protein [Haliea sp. AH-315-K21]|uniref:DUF1552 domain-containing protein n=1 Tax=SAR86 cluster bacterium TaxID=2030880 RepID=A0A2A5CBJ7_9GAMM|nr:DUF1552 domain-containing protein [Haliea sp. AH-315-K21]PCJ41219.1 MAG: hypothetical protein COA71_09280 [SAR86 cluster bacterium]
MFISKKHLSRRTVLRGLGTSVALPLLDAMIPAGTALAQTAANPQTRMGYIFFPHGAVMDRWTPTTVGSDFDMPEILSPAARFKDKMTIVSGLRNRPAESSDPHGIIAGTWLRCVAPNDVSNPEKGVTADQLAARHIGQGTTFPSIEVGTPTGGPCAPGFSCSFGSSLSFSSPQQPLPIENNPRKLFFQLFGQGDNAQERAAIVNETGSILDSILADANSLQRKLGSEDQVMVANYLESVREVERRVQMMKSQDLSGVDIPLAPVGIPEDFEAHLKIMFDLIALSYQINLTNVASFMMEKEVSMRTYNNVGVSEAFHPLSHHGENPAKMAKLARVQQYHTEVFTYFLEKLDAMPEGNGSVLDNSIILFGSNMSNSDQHNNDPLPNAVFGHGGGTIKGGQHLFYEQNTPHANLLLTLLNRAGIAEESFGDSTGVLAEV